MNVKQLINNYLEKSMLLQIATSADNIPWVCTVCFAHDESYNLYWFSRHNTRHSEEIVRNPRVAGAVSLPYALGEKSIGLQFAGLASEIHDEESIMKGLKVLEKRYEVKPERTQQLKKELLDQSGNYGLYVLRPDSIILHDTVNFPKNPRQLYKIPNEKK